MSNNNKTKTAAMEYREFIDLEEKLELEEDGIHEWESEREMNSATSPEFWHKIDDIYNFLNSSYNTQAGQLVIETPIEANIETKIVEAKSYLSSEDFTSIALSLYDGGVTEYLFAYNKNKEHAQTWKVNINSLFTSLESLGIVREDLNTRSEEALASLERLVAFYLSAKLNLNIDETSPTKNKNKKN